jgi:hypothetical protein
MSRLKLRSIGSTLYEVLYNATCKVQYKKYLSYSNVRTSILRLLCTRYLYQIDHVQVPYTEYRVDQSLLLHNTWVLLSIFFYNQKQVSWLWEFYSLAIAGKYLYRSKDRRHDAFETRSGQRTETNRTKRLNLLKALKKQYQFIYSIFFGSNFF